MQGKAGKKRKQHRVGEAVTPEAPDTLPETNMETQKGPYEDYSPSKRLARAVGIILLGRPSGSLNLFPYWFYRDPSILTFFQGSPKANQDYRLYREYSRDYRRII